MLEPAVDPAAVLAEYPSDCLPGGIEPLGAAGGFSGAEFWKIAAPRGTLCLRRWPSEHPTADRLRLIHAVLRHTSRLGCAFVPAPLETRSGATFVAHAGRLWELTPWMPGRADYRQHPSPARLAAAMRALAEFHQAAASFPRESPGPRPSPGIAERLQRMNEQSAAGVDSHRRSAGRGIWPEFDSRADRILDLARRHWECMRASLEQAAQLRVPLQPCIRDIWHDHVLFDGDAVSGIVDFGALRTENVAADCARLLGSLVGDDRQGWQRGLAAYEQFRTLSAGELILARAFDQSGVLLGGLNWIEWVWDQSRRFEDQAGVLARLDEILARLQAWDVAAS